MSENVLLRRPEGDEALDREAFDSSDLALIERHYTGHSMPEGMWKPLLRELERLRTVAAEWREYEREVGMTPKEVASRLAYLERRASGEAWVEDD